MILFQELAPEWNTRLRELEYLNRETVTPELQRYDSCVIGECVKTAGVNTFKSKDMVIPACYLCYQISRSKVLMDIAYGRNVRQNVQKFYREIVPKIVSHYERDHHYALR